MAHLKQVIKSVAQVLHNEAVALVGLGATPMHPRNAGRALRHLQKLALEEDVAAPALEELRLDDDELARLDVTSPVYVFEFCFGDEGLRFVATGEANLKKTHCL